jgi:hypothetical protein
MSKTLTPASISQAAKSKKYNARLIAAIAEVEGNGMGFHPTTGKVLIQFEPGYFKRLITPVVRAAINAAWKAVEAKTATPEQTVLYSNWTSIMGNKVEGQSEEYRIFNIAFSVDPQAAMLSTSWGMGQIMGANFKAAGFKTVDAMVTAFRESIENQFLGMLAFIADNPTLNAVLKDPNPDLADCRLIARFYNGAAYEKFNYHNRIFDAYTKNAKQYV